MGTRHSSPLLHTFLQLSPKIPTLAASSINLFGRLYRKGLRFRRRLLSGLGFRRLNNCGKKFRFLADSYRDFPGAKEVAVMALFVLSKAK